MKKMMYALTLLAVISSGCGKDKGGNNDNHNYANGCYRWIGNNLCVDAQNNPVDSRLCHNTNQIGHNGSHFGGNPGCYGTGVHNGLFPPRQFGGNGLIGGSIYNGFNSGICQASSSPGTFWQPIYFAGTNQTLCMEFSTYQYVNTSYSFYTQPMLGYGNTAYVGCIAGVNVPYNCRCRAMGAQLGWTYAGFAYGVCY